MTPGSTARDRRAYFTAIGLLWVLLALVVLLNQRGIFTPDIKPEVYLSPGRTVGNYRTSWLDAQQLGFPNFNVGLAPVAAVIALLQALGIGPALCVRVVHLVLLILAGWGGARLYVAVTDTRADHGGRLLAGLLYVANPYVVVAGDTLAITLPYAVLPWQVLFLIRSLERPNGWRWPAAFALTFVAMSGLNAGVVPTMQLAYVPAVIWFVYRRRKVRWSQIFGALARCGLLTSLVSLYWLIPAITASGVGSSVVKNSETMTGIAAPSSFSEVLRGLGLWVMYGSGADGPWQPGFTSYLTNPIVVVLSFALPAVTGAAVLLTRGAVRRLALGMVGVAAVVMVGLFPPDDPSPVGRFLRYGFAQIPALGALRTTNKGGAVLMLGAALLVAAAGKEVVRRLAPTRVAIAVACLAVILVGATWPAWSGGLFSDRLNIPDYWKQAAAAADIGPASQRVWLVPGEVHSHYRWSRERVDDIDKALLSRPSLVETTIPNPSPDAANFLTAVDTLLQEGSLPPGALSAAGRYMGVSDLLVRNDLVWEQTNGGRPTVIQSQVADDPGLRFVAGFGAPGQNTQSSTNRAASGGEAALPPVQQFKVKASRLMARIEPLRDSVLVEGDGWSLAPLVAAGLLPHEPSFRYLGDLTPNDLDRALKIGTRLVITDTNRRRTAAIGQLADSQGPLLPAARDPSPSRVLFGSDAQTVLQVQGGSVSGSSSAALFAAQPNATPENAFDGDPRTAWLFGDYGGAVGQHVTLRLPRPQEISEVRLLARPRGPVTIARVRLQAGSVVRSVNVPRTGVVRLSLPPTRADSVQLRVTRTRGSGVNAVGVDEISLSGVRVRRVARLPDRLDTLVRDLDPVAGQALTSTPIDVVLSRALGTQSPADDEETGLDRNFTLPRSRTFRLYGLVRPDSAATDDTIDHLLGVTGDVVATSSSRAFDNPDVRASFALDGNPFTAWSPADPVPGSWLELKGRARRITHIDVRQPTPKITHVRIYLDGQLAADTPLRSGLNRIPVPEQSASTMRLQVTARTGTGVVQVSEVSFGAARMTLRPERALAGCVIVANLDGASLRMRPIQRLTSLGPSVFTACDGPLAMSAGAHHLRAVREWMPDELVFRDGVGDLPAAPTTAVHNTMERLSAAHWRVTATLPPGPNLLVLGQNYDPRWVATLDGRSVGRTLSADGYSAAWVVDAPGKQTFDIRFAPQRYANGALGASAASVLACAAIALWRREPQAVAARVLSTRRRQLSPRGRAPTWLAVVAVAWVLGGPVVGAAAVVLAAWHGWRPPPARRLLQLAVVLLALTPVAFLVGNATRWGEVSAYLVWHNQWPHWLAGCSLLLLSIGVWQQDKQSAELP